ncbi:MAG: DUF3489 domain-containing protein, partial [Anderseniella sp.]|nr:DUF3489 domain-containing protein [Anderseniella sp.]
MPSKKQPGTPISPSRTEKKPLASIKRSPQEANPATKKQQLIDLLSGAKPVAAEKVSKTLDGQPHTVRTAITGLRKSGFVIDSTKG